MSIAAWRGLLAATAVCFAGLLLIVCAAIVIWQWVL